MKITKQTTILLLAVLLFCVIGKASEAKDSGQADGKPNVLFIAIDDLNDWTGILKGNPQAKTPHMDKLASQGMLFTNAHCAAPACGPSRAAIMSGIRPSTSGNYINRGSIKNNPILNNSVLLPEFFQQNGYFVAGSGKLFHGAHFKNEIKGRGFDEYAPSKTQDQFPWVFNLAKPHPQNGIKKGVPRYADWGPYHADVKLEDINDGKTAKWAEGKLLGGELKEPFFLGTGIFQPHLPNYALQEYFDRFPLDEIEIPVGYLEGDMDDVPEASSKQRHIAWAKTIRKAGQWKHAIQAYLASTAMTDDLIGQIVGALAESKYADNTIIVLWSDHGFQLGEKERWAKFSLWERATRVNMVWVAPGVTKPGSTSAKPVNLLDIYPTLASLTGSKPPEGQLEGNDLSVLMKNPEASWDETTVTTFGYKNYGIRSQQYRYIVYEDGSEELYDHAKDKWEWENLASNPEYAAIKKKLREGIPTHHEPLGATAGKRKPNATDLQSHGVTQAELNGLDAIMLEGIEKGTIEGGSFLVAHKGEIVYRKAFGYADIEAKRPFTTEDLLPIASVSKPLAASVIMVLVEQGKLKLDDPVEKYLPAFKGKKVKGSDSPTTPMTIRHLLSHTAGFWGNHKITPEQNDLIRNMERPLSEAVKKMAEYDLIYEPGTKHLYSGTGYCVLGRVAEVVLDQSFEEIAQDALFRPLGMNNTTYLPSTEALKTVPAFYLRQGGKLQKQPSLADSPSWFVDPRTSGVSSSAPVIDLRFILVGGSLFSTLDELAMFGQMHLNDGIYNGKRILSETSVDEMRRLQIPEERFRAPGLGWHRGLPDGNGLADLIFISGAYGAHLQVDRRQQTVTVFLTRSTVKKAVAIFNPLNQHVEQIFSVPAPASATPATQATNPKMKKADSTKANRSNASLHKSRDKNKDGHLTLDEYIGNPDNRNVPVLTKRFNGWDANKDGKVTLDEIQGGK